MELHYKKFPLVRLKQFSTNPAYIWFWLKRYFIYKQSSFQYVENIKNIKQLTANETLTYLIESESSMIRFGDGEFGMMTGAGIYPPDSDWSQRYAAKLKKTLLRQLTSRNKKILIAIPPKRHLAYREGLNLEPEIISSMHTEARMILGKINHQDVLYGDWSIFLPHINPDLDWQKLSDFLKHKTVVIMTGGIGKLGDVKIGIRTIFLECGKHNAFQRKSEIINQIDNLIAKELLVPKETFFMISLGCTSGVIVEHLSKRNYLAWDTGHIFRFAMEKIKSL